MAQVDPALPGPKDCKLRKEELLYQFISTVGQKVSPQQGLDVDALTDNALCSLREQLEILEILKSNGLDFTNFDPNFIISILAGAKP